MAARRLSSLKWLTILGPVFFVAFLTYAAYFYLPAFLPASTIYVIVILLTAAAAFLFSHLIFKNISSREREIARQQRELSALNQVSEAVTASLDLVEVLSRALDAILELTHTGAGRVWLVDAEAGVLRNAVHRGLFPDAFAQPAQAKVGEGTAGQVAATGRAASIPDLANAPDRLLEPLRARGFIELSSVPLVAQDRVVGVIDIAARHRGELSAGTLELLVSMGRAVGLAIENARLFDAVRARQVEAENLYKAGMDVSSTLDVGQVLHAVTERGRALLHADASALCLWDEHKRWLVVGSESGPAEAFESPVGMGRKNGLFHGGRAQGSGGDPACSLIRSPFRQARVALPVSWGEQVIGCLCVASTQARSFSAREVQVLGGLADQAAIGIRNARAYDRAGNEAITQERERLAREMHDTLAQVLGFVSTKSQAARELLACGRVESAGEQLEQIATLSQELYADVREAILGLRAAISPEKGLLPTLGDYIQAYTKQSGVEAQLVVENGANGLLFAPAVELQLIRIVQEALTNIRKHARARRATVRLTTQDGHAEMRIEDDGCGFDPDRVARGFWPQFGLQTMRERAESVGGAFVVVSRLGLGTQVVVQIPLGYVGGR